MEKLKLPEEFLLNMKELLGGEYDAFLSAMAERPMSGLRVNTLKAEPGSISRYSVSDSLITSAFRSFVSFFSYS